MIGVGMTRYERWQRSILLDKYDGRGCCVCSWVILFVSCSKGGSDAPFIFSTLGAVFWLTPILVFFRIHDLLLYPGQWVRLYLPRVSHRKCLFI